MSEKVILCVDDEPLVLTSLQRELQDLVGEAYLVETAEDGDEALELFAELSASGHEIPIVISDQIMPGMRGDELLQHIHARAPHTLTIMLTGQADLHAVTKAVNYARLYRYLAKPWEKTDLRLTINAALHSYAQDQQLAEQNRVLADMNDLLERQVRERTAELEHKNRQLQELNTSKDKFFSIISHDLRSPLNTLLGFARLLVEKFDQYHVRDIKQKVSHLLTSAERLYALLENLLTWSRLQRGGMEYHPETLDIGELAADNIALFLTKAEQKQITLRSEIQATISAYADASMVDTILRNLISNALKFTSAGGQVLVSAVNAERFVQVTVADTGVGIPAEVLPRLLRLDTQYTNVGTSGETGTGLGLILCKELVEHNGGAIWAESTLGQGTIFRFTLCKA